MNGLRSSSRLLGIGFYVAICILGGLLGGLWLDQQVGLTPLFTLLGLLLGMAAGITGAVRAAQRAADQ